MLALKEFAELVRLYAEYAASVDSGNWDGWMDCFAEECEYLVKPRENFERNLPLATIRLISKGMLKDRVYACSESLYHDPYYQRHMVGIPYVTGVEDGRILSEANYAVFRTKLNEETTLFNVGKYVDMVVREGGMLKFSSRTCVYDSEMVPNSIIYPL